jgi:hypothetical protein
MIGIDARCRAAFPVGDGHTVLVSQFCGSEILASINRLDAGCVKVHISKMADR